MPILVNATAPVIAAGGPVIAGPVLGAAAPIHCEGGPAVVRTTTTTAVPVANHVETVVPVNSGVVLV